MAAAQPGYLGLDSVRDPVSRFGITVSYWRDEASARAWKDVAEHREAQRLGQAHWYEHYTVRVAIVEREYGGPDPRPRPTRRADRRPYARTRSGSAGCPLRA